MISLTTLRTPKIWNMAIFDLVGTFIFSMIVHSLLWFYPLEMKNKEKRTIIQYISSSILIFLMFLGLGVIFHRIFNIKSGLSAHLGFNDVPVR